MDHGEISATISQMRDAAASIGASATRINDCIDAVDNEIKAIGPDRFMSDAAESFRAQYNRLTPQLREAYDGLIMFQRKLNTAADDIEAAARPT